MSVVGVVDGVCGCVGVVLVVNVEAVEGRNISNICAPNRSQQRCFMFYDVLLRFTLFYLYTLKYAVLNCLPFPLIVEFERPKRQNFILCIYYE